MFRVGSLAGLPPRDRKGTGRRVRNHHPPVCGSGPQPLLIHCSHDWASSPCPVDTVTPPWCTFSGLRKSLGLVESHCRKGPLLVPHVEALEGVGVFAADTWL